MAGTAAGGASGNAGVGGTAGGGNGGAGGAGASGGTGGTAGAAGTGGAATFICNQTNDWRGDFDGDGVDDCAHAQTGTATRLDLAFHKGLGGGVYDAAAVVTPDTVPPAYQSLSLNGRRLVFDLNHDGRQDIIVHTVDTLAPAPAPSDTYIQLLRGQADGTFQRVSLPPSLPDGLHATGRPFANPIVIDLDADGFSDLLSITTDDATYATFYWLALKSSGGSDFQVSQFLLTQNLRGVPFFKAAAKLDGDAYLDLVALAQQNPAAATLGYKNYVTVTFTAGGGAAKIAGTDNATDVTVSDVNTDGKLDLVVTLAGGPTPFYGNGAGQFSTVAP
jgi:hypothetical protein